MSPAIVPLLMIGAFVAFFGLIVWAAARQSKRTAENIRLMAETLGLQYAEKPPILGIFTADPRARGTLRGKRVELFTFATGSGKSRTQWCAVSATTATSGGLTFHLQRQGFGTKFMELFGSKEITVGDAEFDQAWFIQTNQPEFFREALLPELRAKITAVLRELGTQVRGMEFKLEHGVVRYAEIGTFSSDDRCQRCVRAADIVCDLADVAEVFAEQQPGR